MTAPFRELFVEFLRAPLEALQGIAEAAVAAATPRPLRQESQLLTLLRNANARRLLAERYNWRRIDEPILVADENAVDLVVWRACGHPSRVRIDGWLLEQLRQWAALDELDRVLFRHHERGRRCYCVEGPR